MAITLHELLTNTYEQIAYTILAILIIQLVLHASIDRVVGRIVRSHHRYETEQEEKKRRDTLSHFFHTASGTVLWTVGIIVILYEMNINIAALLTGAGVVSVVFGLGAQSMIKDLLAGMFVILENQYGVGDIIKFKCIGVGSVTGTVEEVNLRTTKLRDFDGNLHLVPNGSAGITTNLSNKYANVSVDIGIGYGSDIDKAEDMINKVGKELATDKKWHEIFVQPIKFLRVEDFGDTAIVIKTIGRVQPARQWEAAGEFRRRLKKTFDEAGISMPHPEIGVERSKKK